MRALRHRPGQGMSTQRGVRPMKNSAAIHTKSGVVHFQSSATSPTRSTANGIRSSATTLTTVSNIPSSVILTIRIVSQNGPATMTAIHTIIPPSAAGMAATVAYRRSESIRVAEPTNAWTPTPVRIVKHSAPAGTVFSARAARNTATDIALETRTSAVQRARVSAQTPSSTHAAD